MRLNSVSARSLATRENTARVIPYPRVCGTLRALCACLWSYVPKCYFSLTCTLFQVPSVGTNNAMSYHCLLSSSVLPPQWGHIFALVFVCLFISRATQYLEGWDAWLANKSWLDFDGGLDHDTGIFTRSFTIAVCRTDLRQKSAVYEYFYSS